MNNAVFVKTIKNIRKKRDIKLVRTNKWRTYSVSEPNSRTVNGFQKIFYKKKRKKPEY